MSGHEKINYVELPAADLAATKQFYSRVFGWVFADYGPDYVAFANSGLDGGFYRAKTHSAVADGAALVVLYSKDLAQTESKIFPCLIFQVLHPKLSPSIEDLCIQHQRTLS